MGINVFELLFLLLSTAALGDPILTRPKGGPSDSEKLQTIVNLMEPCNSKTSDIEYGFLPRLAGLSARLSFQLSFAAPVKNQDVTVNLNIKTQNQHQGMRL